MKKSKIFNCKEKCMVVIFIVAALFITNCSESPMDEEVIQNTKLKSARIFPNFVDGEFYHFKGMVNDDSIEVIIPEYWNGSFLVYAHGYVDPILPISLPNDSIAGILLKNLITSPDLGFAYASTSYSENGFAVKEAVMDIMFLGKMIKAHFKPDKIFLGGVSEGGLVATKALEKNQHVFDAGLVSCGPVGNFQGQLQYFGDFHVLFKHLYAIELASIPPMLGGPIDIGSPAHVPPQLMQAWEYGNLKTLIGGILASNPDKLKFLLQIANVPVNANDLTDEQLIGVAMEILRFNIMATNDMIDRVHGIPYDNTEIVYPGLSGVERIEGDKQAIHRVKLLYETKGTPGVPVVFMHTLGDHVVPAWHMVAYMEKVYSNELTDNVEYFPIASYGHCYYTLDQVMNAVYTMIEMSN